MTSKKSVLKLITEASQNKWRSFSLSGKKLSTLPPEIGLLTSLETLDLSDNLFVSLPTEITYLKNLKRIDLSRNRLKTLPDKIGQLTSTPGRK